MTEDQPPLSETTAPMSQDQTTGSRDCLGYLRWTLTSCRRCGYERADCSCIGGFAEPVTENQTTAPITDFELVMGAAKRIAEDYEEPCSCRPPCGANDWDCACIRRAKLALGIEGHFTATWDEIYGS